MSTLFDSIFSFSGPEFRLRGKVIPSNSKLDIQRIGAEDKALHCVTPFQNCCKHNRRGEIFRVDENNVRHRLPKKGDNMRIYRNRGPSVVRLNNRRGTEDVGTYECCIPNACNEEECIQITLV